VGRAVGVLETSSDGVDAVDGGVSACVFVGLDILGGAGEKVSFTGTGEGIAAGAGACCANGGGTWAVF
jgi:hypothetical protein